MNINKFLLFWSISIFFFHLCRHNLHKSKQHDPFVNGNENFIELHQQMCDTIIYKLLWTLISLFCCLILWLMKYSNSYPRGAASRLLFHGIWICYDFNAFPAPKPKSLHSNHTLLFCIYYKFSSQKTTHSTTNQHKWNTMNTNNN